MAEGFPDPLALSGVWLYGTTGEPPEVTGGYRDLAALCGVMLPGLGALSGAVEEDEESVYLPQWRRRRR